MPAYPSGFSKDAKRALRQQAVAFEECDGVLFHKMVDSAAGTTSLQRVLVMQEEKTRVLTACHSGKAYQTLYFRTVAPIGHAQSVLNSMNITCTNSANILLLSVLLLYAVYFNHYMYKMNNYAPNYNGHAQVMVQLYLHLEIIIH